MKFNVNVMSHIVNASKRPGPCLREGLDLCAALPPAGPSPAWRDVSSRMLLTMIAVPFVFAHSEYNKSVTVFERWDPKMFERWEIPMGFQLTWVLGSGLGAQEGLP